MATARIEKYHGEPALVIDGKAYPPFTYWCGEVWYRA